MEYGCIGEHLKHSFSKEIHNELADYNYELCEVARDEFSSFLTARNFKAINVTIPYKELVIPHLSYIDESAKEIGAVNTVVNRNGRLFGYNTDFFGMKALISHAKIALDGKKVIILGTGGTSKTAEAVAKSLNAASIYRVGRTGRGGALTYEQLYSEHLDADIIINTTPVGMFPDIYASPIDLSLFERLCGVIDVVYNPLRTELVSSALERGIPAEGGLYMLVGQAIQASEIFVDTSYSDKTAENIFSKLRAKKENIVLIGMPASGKTTVGKKLADISGRKFVDTDDLICQRVKKQIPDIFAEYGEAEFRRIESEAIKELSSDSSLVIATGGGAVLREENTKALRMNGRMYFIDRALDKLVPTNDRPLSSNKERLSRLYTQRYGIYNSVADKKIDGNRTPLEIAEEIWGDMTK